MREERGQGPGQGARTIAELRDILSRLNTAEGIAASLQFQPRADDVLIASYPKSGTTWMQQIVHGLKTCGDMDFADITEVVPWIELAHVLDLDLEADQSAAPRAFKTHWRGDEAPAGMRTIFIYRDPKAVAVSYYQFYAGWVLEPDAISLSEFVNDYFVHGTLRGTYWTHLRSWIARRDEPDVLVLSYEGLQAEFEAGVRRIAAFMGLEVSPECLEIAMRQAGRDFMTAHTEKFDEHLVAGKRNAAMGVAAERHPQKIQSSGRRVSLSAEDAARLDAIWAEEIAGPLGYASYEALRRDCDGG